MTLYIRRSSVEVTCRSETVPDLPGKFTFLVGPYHGVPYLYRSTAVVLPSLTVLRPGLSSIVVENQGSTVAGPPRSPWLDRRAIPDSVTQALSLSHTVRDHSTDDHG